jgi:putative DNA primase/helicase
MTAETIAKALGGHRAGATWMARCPVHDDCEPSLSISSGKDGKSAGRFAQKRRHCR